MATEVLAGVDSAVAMSAGEALVQVIEFEGWPPAIADECMSNAADCPASADMFEAECLFLSELIAAQWLAGELDVIAGHFASADPWELQRYMRDYIGFTVT